MEGLDNVKISEEKKKYIVEQLNPVLEEMVAECITKMPKDPIPFMVNWLESKSSKAADEQLSAEDRERFRKENLSLEQELTKTSSQVQEAALIASKETGGDNAESEEEDDDDDEPPPGWEKSEASGAKARQSVSAEAYGAWNQKKAFSPPVIPKTEEQSERLKNCLEKSFMFQSLEQLDLDAVIGAMAEVKLAAKERAINQGDDGDFLFVIESGKLNCIITVDGAEKVVKTCEAGDVFGELALLYNCPRAASVESSEACVLWKLDRDTFNHIVKDSAQKKRQRYEIFLEKVPILSSMDQYERSQVADALRVEIFADGDAIVNQGENGNKFYILESGEAVATKSDQVIMNYTTGDYFGELALLRNQPRAATVKAKGVTKCLTLEGRSFKRLLNVNDLLERSSSKYS